MSTPLPTGNRQRTDWLARLDRLVSPVLDALAAGQLRQRMPVACRPGCEPERARFTHLEALGRSLAGLAPFLELDAPGSHEVEPQARLIERSRAAIRNAIDPASPDHCNFTEGTQPVVDAAFLAHALLRAPRRLASGWSDAEHEQLVTALRSTRRIRPHFNNWLLFSATIEAALDLLGEAADPMRVDYALKQHEQWYLGDGMYGDGPDYHADAYNGFVIQPMLIDVLDRFAGRHGDWDAQRERVLIRARRHAVQQERGIACDGSFAPVGRSLVYRCGAYQLPAQLALQDRLPATPPPGQWRCALDAVIARSLDAPGTVDAEGWLRIGLNGHQPGMGEGYISTGSLYLCSVAFLPLGLPPTAPFWQDASRSWSARRLWVDGEDLGLDAALKEPG